MERQDPPQDDRPDPATGVDPNTSDVRGGPRGSTTSDPGRQDPVVPGQRAESPEGDEGTEEGDEQPGPPWPPVRP